MNTACLCPAGYPLIEDLYTRSQVDALCRADVVAHCDPHARIRKHVAPCQLADEILPVLMGVAAR